MQKLKKFRPTWEDRDWLTNIYHQLEDGSQLITDVATYERSNGVLVVKKVNQAAFEAGFDNITIEKEIHKMRATADAVEIKFFDARPEVSN
jgi:hypothetical protein